MVLQLDEMLTWGITSNHQWDATVSGPRGITPLHLAAMLPSDDVLDLLTGKLLQQSASECMVAGGARSNVIGSVLPIGGSEHAM